MVEVLGVGGLNQLLFTQPPLPCLDLAEGVLFSQTYPGNQNPTVWIALKKLTLTYNNPQTKLLVYIHICPHNGKSN